MKTKGIKPSKNIIWKKVDNETVLLNKKNGYYYSLDPIGTEIWAYITKGLTVDGIADKITDRYRTTREKAKKDINSLLRNLKKEKIIT